MPVQIRIPTPLRRQAGEQTQVEVPPGSVAEAFDSLFERHPGLKPHLLGDGGRVRSFVNVFVAGEDIRFLDGLKTAVSDGEEIAIVPAIAGGSSLLSRGTRAVRGGEPRVRPDNAVTQPIVCTATYSFRDRAEMADHFEGRIEREEYGRYGNPTVRAAERKVAALDGAEDAALFGSGMAAVSTALLAMVRSGQHVVLTKDCYRRTRQLVTAFLSRFGIESTLVPPGDVAAVEAAIQQGRTRLVLTESPTNPYLRVVDIPAFAEVVRRNRGVKLLVDSTFATPVNQRPLELGADLVLHSGTKYLGGHNDLLAGSLSGSADLVGGIRDLRGVLGTLLDPHSAYLLIRGIKTLELRVTRQNTSAQRVAEWLEAHPLVERVFYPGLSSHPDHAVAAAQMTGFGGVVSFIVKGGLEGAAGLVDAVKLPLIAPSLGGVETLIEQPALMSFWELTTEERKAIGIEEGLVRLSVGIEDPEDLIADLAGALAKLPGAEERA